MRVFTVGLILFAAVRGCSFPYPFYPTPRAAAADVALPLAASEKEKESIPILTYHRFGPTAVGLTTISIATFEYQLNYLSTHGYTVITLHSLIDWLRGTGPAPPAHAVVITVDDGHKSVYSDLLPIVRRYRIPVTLFIYPSAISNASYALTWDELAELKATGLFDIESHTYWHPNFNDERKRLSAKQYEQFVDTQFAKSKQELEGRLRIHVDLLAWPYGIFDEYLTAEAEHAGYIAAFALGNRRATPADPIRAEPRYLVTESDKGTRFEVILGAGGPKDDPAFSGTVIDGVTSKPIDGAIVTQEGTEVITDESGGFHISGVGSKLRVRAPGYLRLDVDGLGADSQHLRIELTPFKPKALYLSFYGVGSAALREPALKLIGETELNAVVVDAKGDRGMIPFKTSIPLAQTVGADRVITVRDIRSLMTSFKAKGIYTIARIVVFKDDPLAHARPDLAVKTAGGEIWHDREGLAWTDPFDREVRDYNIDVAVEAAEAGFDEVQFDYVRFPDAKGIVFTMPDTEDSRLEAISEFLREARKRLAPYNVFIASDIFGYVCWNLNDTGIGQRLENLAPYVDYISPMLYPSAFQAGIPGYADPVMHSHEIVYRSLENAIARTHIPAVRFRPWLQDFRDYAFDRRQFGADEIRSQIDAAESFGSGGWMLWDPHNVYSAAGLKGK